MTSEKKTAEELQRELDTVSRICKRQQAYVGEYQFVERALIAAGIVSEEKLQQAHDLYRDLKA